MHSSLNEELVIYGLASKKTTRLVFEDRDLHTCLMVFLQQHSIPVASSCRGEGVCKKCLLKNILSCQISLQEYIEKFGNYLEIDYW